MAANVTDIVSLLEARTFMRMVGADSQHDALIVNFLHAAAEYVEEQTRLGIVDTVTEELLRTPSGDNPLVLYHRSVTVTGVSVRDATEVAAETRDAGPITQGIGTSTIQPPENGWPDGAYMTVQFTRSTPAASVPGTLRTAILFLARDMYDGREKRSQAVLDFIMPYRDLSVAPDDVSNWPVPRATGLPLIPETPSTPVTPTGPALMAAWSEDQTFTATEFTSGTDSMTNEIELPTATGRRYLGLWRATTAGGRITTVTSEVVFGRIPVNEGFALEINGVAGWYVATNITQNAGVLAGTRITVA